MYYERYGIKSIQMETFHCNYLLIVGDSANYSKIVINDFAVLTIQSWKIMMEDVIGIAIMKEFIFCDFFHFTIEPPIFNEEIILTINYT